MSSIRRRFRKLLLLQPQRSHSDEFDRHLNIIKKNNIVNHELQRSPRFNRSLSTPMGRKALDRMLSHDAENCVCNPDQGSSSNNSTKNSRKNSKRSKKNKKDDTLKRSFSERFRRKKANENDDCRFDVSVNESVWYLRAENQKERNKWMDALDQFKSESGYGSQGDLRRHGSTLSLTSNRSHASGTTYKKIQNLSVKIAELETFRDIVCRQVENLQLHFDGASVPSGKTHRRAASDLNGIVYNSYSTTDTSSEAGSVGSSSVTLHSATSDPANADPTSPSKTHKRSVSHSSAHDTLHQDLNVTLGRQSVSSHDFRGEALTFKATTAGIIATLNHCVELMRQSEETWKKKFDKEFERRRRCEDNYRELLTQHKELQAAQQRVMGGPDFQEGPNSPLNEDEWHDALDAALERQDFEEARLERLLSTSESESTLSKASPANILLSKKHYLYNEIDQITREQLRYAREHVDESGQWQLFTQDGEMKMYKREIEVDGIMNDPLKAYHSVKEGRDYRKEKVVMHTGNILMAPLKAYHSVKGVTASEYLHYFFEADYKIDWDTTLEAVHVVEKSSEDTMIIHQVHKRIWPSAQREALFWSHLRNVSNEKDINAFDQYIVCNHNTNRDDCQPIKKDNVRVGMTVAMVCQTIIDKAACAKPLSQLTRNNITCKLVYVAQVNPGGWVPLSAARAIYKKEYPKFLKLFTQYVLHKTEKKPLRIGS